MIARRGEQEYYRLTKFKSEELSPIIHTLDVSQDFVWLGTPYGLYQFDKTYRKFVNRFIDNSTKDSANLNFINDVTIDPSGKIWVAYARNGIKSMLPSEGKLISYPETREFSPRYVQKDSSGLVWFQTESGFYRFLPGSGKVDDFTNIGTIEFDGASTRPAHSIRGKWYFSTRSRFISFLEPDKVPLQLPTAAPIITAFNIFNKPVSFDPDSSHLKQFVLKHWQNVISYEFSCPLFTRSEKITFDYMLEGFDENWVHAGNERMVNYTNLDGGDYVFKVRAYNSLGQLHPEPAIFMLHVQTPYWRTWWFISLCALALIGLVAAVFRYREIQRRRLVHIRDEIARDLHDDMGSNLSSISILSQNIEKLSKLDPEKARIALNKITETAQGVMETMNDIVWSVNPENDSMEHLVERMREVAGEVWEIKDTVIDFNVDPAILKLTIAPDKRRDLFLIFKEALTNSFRYSEAGIFTVRLMRESNFLTILIEDNGQGFNAANPVIRNEGNGLRNMRKRASKWEVTLKSILHLAMEPASRSKPGFFRCKEL